MEDNDITELAPDAVRIHAGFPNPAAERFQAQASLALSLDQLLVRHPSSTYFFRISGNHWNNMGIFDGDIALIDRALSPSSNDLVIFWQNDSFALCRYSKLPKREEPKGIVTAIIHRFHQ